MSAIRNLDYDELLDPIAAIMCRMAADLGRSLDELPLSDYILIVELAAARYYAKTGDPRALPSEQ